MDDSEIIKDFDGLLQCFISIGNNWEVEEYLPGKKIFTMQKGWDKKWFIM